MDEITKLIIGILLTYLVFYLCHKKNNSIRIEHTNDLLHTSPISELNGKITCSYKSGRTMTLSADELDNMILSDPELYDLLFSSAEIINTIKLSISSQHFIRYMHRKPTDYNINELIMITDNVTLIDELTKYNNINNLLLTMIRNNLDVKDYIYMYYNIFTFDTQLNALKLLIKNKDISMIKYLFSRIPKMVE